MRPNTGGKRRCCRSILQISNEIGPQRLLCKRKQLSFFAATNSRSQWMTSGSDGSQPDRCFHVAASLAIARSTGLYLAGCCRPVAGVQLRGPNIG